MILEPMSSDTNNNNIFFFAKYIGRQMTIVITISKKKKHKGKKAFVNDAVHQVKCLLGTKRAIKQNK